MKAFFSRVAALAFEQSVLQDLEKRPSTQSQLGDGDGDLIRAYREGLGGAEEQDKDQRATPAILNLPLLLSSWDLWAASHISGLRPLCPPPTSSGTCPSTPLLDTQAPFGPGVGTRFSDMSCFQLT